MDKNADSFNYPPASLGGQVNVGCSTYPTYPTYPTYASVGDLDQMIPINERLTKDAGQSDCPVQATFLE